MRQFMAFRVLRPTAHQPNPRKTVEIERYSNRFDKCDAAAGDAAELSDTAAAIVIEYGGNGRPRIRSHYLGPDPCGLAGYLLPTQQED